MVGIIALLMMILIYLFVSRKKIEGYSERIKNKSLTECANFCKTTAGCFGFAYDQEGICYPSKVILTGKPGLDSLYRSEYFPQNIQCNKVQPVIEADDKVPFDIRRKNSVFACSEKQDMHPQWYLHTNGEFYNTGEGKNIDEIFDIDQYQVKNYDWPINKYNVGQVDLLIQDRARQYYTPENVSQIKRMEKVIFREPKKLPEYKKRGPKLDFGLDKLFQRRVEGFNFTQKDDYNKGVYPHCARNIPLKNCLKACDRNKECIGVEWNPKYGEDKNVCCPYKSLGVYIPRKPHFCYGNFYEKTDKKIGKDDIGIIIGQSSRSLNDPSYSYF